MSRNRRLLLRLQPPSLTLGYTWMLDCFHGHRGHLPFDLLCIVRRRRGTDITS